jgi:hypothetical protein
MCDAPAVAAIDGEHFVLDDAEKKLKDAAQKRLRGARGSVLKT